MQMIGQHFEDSSEDAVLAPALESSVRGGRCSIAARQINPLRTGAQNPNDSIESRTGIGPRSSGTGREFFDWNESLKIVPLMVGEVHP